MIDFLEGTIEEINEKRLIINVAGVGYGVNITSGACNALHDKDGLVRLYTYMSVRENAMELFGFASPEEKELFLALLNVEGIGPRAATNILSGISVDRLKKAIASGDEGILTQVPGLGPKKARRLIVELKDKFKSVAGTGEEAGAEDEYLEALLALGFNYAKSREAIKQALKTVKDRNNREDVVREAIKRMA
ncbi:MAG: Holliday junction branch migration protein RuvA [Spirochaetia bacterium]|nr:Holliday junction branch migration protein RuvA [Spirochaetia bacterium]